MRNTSFNRPSPVQSMLKGAGIVLLVGLVLATFYSYFNAMSNGVAYVTATVTDKTVKRAGSGDDAHDKYMIFTSAETFEDTDTFLFGKHNSSDMYGQIQTGKTYRFKVCGWRNEYTSQYRNILEVSAP